MKRENPVNKEHKPAHKGSRGRRMIAALVVIGLVPVVFLASKSVMSSRPDDLGAKAGRLAGCSDSPNCVSTAATDDEHSVAPLTFDGTAEEAMARLKGVIENMPRTVVVTANESYLHAEFTTLIFRYTDDVEFQINAKENTIQIRSASRIGYSDLGANRTRVEAIRTAFDSVSADGP
jgi:uncharacterized protein (DUF1499 family)